MNLKKWIDEMATLCHPDRVHVCDGSDEEYDRIASEMVKASALVLLDPKKRPHSFWCHSHPDDVARVEENTFICSNRKEDAGPTNHWDDPTEMHKRLRQLFSRCMKGRTMYVILYCMGPLGSPLARF